MTRLVDTREYVSALRELTEEGREVSLLISGSSMSPFFNTCQGLYLFPEAGPGAAQGRYGVFSEGFGAVCHAQDPESTKRGILSGGRRPDPGGRPCKERADLRSGVLCPEKGKKDKAGGFLVGIFCSRLAGPPAGPAFFVGILWETVRSRKKRK